MGEQQSGKEQSRVDEILDAQIEKQISEFWDQVDPRDPYSVLMMPPQSELRDIKRKYRALMLSFHSDKTTSLAISDQHKIDLSEIAQAINQAYTYLTRGDNGRPFLLFESNRMRKSKKGESVDPESTLPHGEALSSLDTSQLKAGDFIHVKTRNSYYVFEVFFDESGKPSAKFSSGPSTLSGAMGRLSTSVEVGERFNVGTASTSDVVEMRVLSSAKRQINMEGSLASVDTSQLKAGDFIHVKTRNSYYVFEVFFDESGKPSAKFSSGPSTLSGAMGRLSTSVEVGERFNVGTASTSDVVEMRINRQSTRIIEFER